LLLLLFLLSNVQNIAQNLCMKDLIETPLYFSSCVCMCLQVNASSYERLVFCSSSGAQLEDKDKLGKIVWATWTW